MSRKHYDLYDDGKLAYHNVTANEIGEMFALKTSVITNDIKYDRLIAGKYMAFDVNENKEGVSQENYSAEEFVKKFGLTAFREWLTLNLKYGRR